MVSFDLETQTGEPKANGVSGVILGVRSFRNVCARRDKMN